MTSSARTGHPGRPAQLGETSVQVWYDRPLFEIQTGEALERLIRPRRWPS